MGACGGVRPAPAHPGIPAGWPFGALIVRSSTFFIVAAVAGLVLFGLSLYAQSEYFYFAGYVVLQYVVLATAWNILGGYCGYVNFGSAAFFALGAYSSVALHKFDASIDKWFPEPIAGALHAVFPLPIPILVLFGGFVSAVVGFGMGYLTLRLRGAFFAIATLALAVVLQTLIINWDYVGGSRGAYVIRPGEIFLGDFRLTYIQYLFLIMLALSVIALTMARTIERSRLGYGFATIRDDELAAEASGVPTLRLKLTATTLSGMLMGMAGAPFPYYIGYLQPSSAFGLEYAVNSIAMPMIGGTTSWIGPLVGAILLGTLQQIATVTISSAANLLLVGVLLVAFVIIAPNGLVGLVQEFLRRSVSAVLHVQIGLVLIAAYGFISGMLLVTFGIPVFEHSAGSIAIGSSIVLGGLLFITSAYGLMTLQSWSHRLTLALLVLSCLVVPAYMVFGPTGYLVQKAVIVIVSLVAIWLLLQPGAKLLYQRSAGAEAARPATVGIAR
jgi:branched-chain amino acid transport system permease protein